jgi:dienelactone hydrolase
LDVTDQEGVVIYPTSGNSSEHFPVLSYAHGAAGGGWYTFEGYFTLWRQLASHGFVVVAPKSCSVGCKAGGWSTYYLEQLKMFEWAKNQTTAGVDPSIFNLIDWDAGVGIVGHSMGGQATVRSAAQQYVDAYNIKAAVLHHPEVDKGGAKMVVPTAAFTGTADGICPPAEAHTIWDPSKSPASRRYATACALSGSLHAGSLYLYGDADTHDRCAACLQSPRGRRCSRTG